MSSFPWVWKLMCGCEMEVANKEGIAQTRIFDGLNGVNVRCLIHGWTLRIKDAKTN